MANLSSPPPSNPKHAKVIWFCIILFVTGIVVFYNYLMKLKYDALHQAERPAFKGQLRHNLEATEMRGQAVSIGQLEGKVWVCGYLYTTCPRGCLGLAERMKKLQDEFGSNPNFQLVSVSLNAEADTPERLRQWTEAKGISGNNWWFLTGNGNQLRGYMRDEFKLLVREIPEKDRLIPDDKYEHKLALVLVDQRLRIRGTYDFSDPGFYDVYEANLNKDIQSVLAETPTGDAVKLEPPVQKPDEPKP